MRSSFGEVVVGQNIVRHYFKSCSMLLSFMFFVLMDRSHFSMEQRRPELRMLSELLFRLLRFAKLLLPLFWLFANAFLLRLLANSLHLVLEVKQTFGGYHRCLLHQNCKSLSFNYLLFKLWTQSIKGKSLDAKKHLCPWWRTPRLSPFCLEPLKTSCREHFKSYSPSWRSCAL